MASSKLFPELPLELLCEVIKFLPLTDLQTLSLASRSMPWTLNAIHPADFDALHKMSIGPNIVEYTKIHGTT